jgi:HK97 family phage prohead protease
MKIETGLALEIDTKAVSDSGEFEGYASRFNQVDQGRDIVRPGAFAKSLANRPAGKVRMLRGHSTDEPIGVWIDLAEDSQGLRVKGRLIRETVKGAETYALMKEGALDGLSIGYRTVRDTFDRQKKLRFLEEVDLREISVVVFPMLESARVSTVKGEPDEQLAVVNAIRRWEAALRA